VKTGNSAPDPLTSSTRRQLLEYLIACKVDGVLVVDVEARRIRSLVFPARNLPPARPAASLFWPVFLAGVGMSWIMLRTGSMRAVVVAHGVVNAFSLVVISLFAPAS